MWPNVYGYIEYIVYFLSIENAANEQGVDPTITRLYKCHAKNNDVLVWVLHGCQ